MAEDGQYYHNIWTVLPQHMDSTTVTYGQYYRNIWTVLPQHMDSTTATYGQYYRNIWTVLPQHMASTTATYGQYYPKHVTYINETNKSLLWLTSGRVLILILYATTG